MNAKNVPRLPSSVYCRCQILATSPFWQMQSNPDRVVTSILYRGAFTNLSARLLLVHDVDCHTACRVKVFFIITSAKERGSVTAKVSLVGWMFAKTNKQTKKALKVTWVLMKISGNVDDRPRSRQLIFGDVLACKGTLTRSLTIKPSTMLRSLTCLYSVWMILQV